MGCQLKGRRKEESGGNLQEKQSEESMKKPKKGLYYNIMKKRERIASGSGERMRKPGTAGAPTSQAFKDAAKTAKKK
jgi:hypothetical protein